MLSTLLNRLKSLNCETVTAKHYNILEKDYGISCNKVETDYKYYKIQKDFFNYYNKFTSDELKALDLLSAKKENKLKNIVTVDDEMYNWFLANINSINTALTKPQHKTFYQKTDSLTWIFDHNLGFEVNIEVLDENNNPILGYTRTDSNNFNRITLTWSTPVKGKIIAS